MTTDDERASRERFALMIVFILLFCFGGWKIDDKLSQILHAVQACGAILK